jgi:predicted nucleotide-binding protein
MTASDDLFKIASKLAKHAELLKKKKFSKPLEIIEKAAKKVGESWSGSWLGYHSRIYYRDFAVPPPGTRFSQEWGLKRTTFFQETIGEWVEYRFEDVIDVINQLAGNPDISKQEYEAQKVRDFFEEAQSSTISNLSSACIERPNDNFIAEILEKAKKEKILFPNDFIKALRPSGQFLSRDMVAIEKGLQTPPHFSILSKVWAIRQPFMACDKLAKITRRSSSHLSIQKQKTVRGQRINNKIFIGHGRSPVWKDLKDFVQDRLHLPWDEFNRIPIAGVTNIERLSQMLDDVAVALIIMTADDEQIDGKLHARMNVIHEVGLFQGRLSFKRTIVLIEEGCEEFSNIQGLGHIRFPKGNISAVFEEIRQVLEREEIIIP